MLKKKREDRIVFTIFDSMHEKFAGLVVNGAQLSKKTNTKIISQVFKLWRLKFINQRNFNFKRHCLEEKIRMKMLTTVVMASILSSMLIEFISPTTQTTVKPAFSQLLSNNSIAVPVEINTSAQPI